MQHSQHLSARSYAQTDPLYPLTSTITYKRSVAPFHSQGQGALPHSTHIYQAPSLSVLGLGQLQEMHSDLNLAPNPSL